MNSVLWNWRVQKVRKDLVTCLNITSLGCAVLNTKGKQTQEWICIKKLLLALVLTGLVLPSECSLILHLMHHVSKHTENWGSAYFGPVNWLCSSLLCTQDECFNVSTSKYQECLFAVLGLMMNLLLESNVIIQVYKICEYSLGCQPWILLMFS